MTNLMNQTKFTNQLISLGEARDLADAQYIYDVFYANLNYQETMNVQEEKYSMAAVNIVDRNAFHKMWEEARIPKGKGQRFSHNKPYIFPWSKKARDLYEKGGKLARKFHLEHTLELKIIKNEAIRRMKLEDSDDKAIKNAEDMLSYLNDIHRETAFVILTSEEHSRLPKRNPDDDPWDFYEKQGIYKKDCISLIEAGLVER